VVSSSFVIGLAVVVTAVLGSRFLVPGLPLRRVATPISVSEAMLSGVGVAGLALHCGAMFFPHLVEPVLGAGGVASDIRALSTASIIWYVVPSAMVLFGLRRQHPVALTAVALALVAVGVTMYNGGSLQVHLVAIFVSVLALASTASLLVLPPSRRGPATFRDASC